MDSSWLKDEYNSEQKVKALPMKLKQDDPGPGITDEQRTVLNGFFVRQGGLAEELSETDLKSIAQAYSGEPHACIYVHIYLYVTYA